MRYFAGRTGWPDTYEKNTQNKNRESSLVMKWQNYPEFFLGMSEATLRSTGLALVEWLKRGQRKRLLARYSEVGLVYAVNVEFGFPNKF